jgi:hypothetical protein
MQKPIKFYISSCHGRSVREQDGLYICKQCREVCGGVLKSAVKEAKMKEKYEKLQKKLRQPNRRTLKKMLETKLWKITSGIVRSLSDKCYTCDKPLQYKDRSACHFWAKGTHGAVRYDLDNLRSGCNTCNVWKSGNLAEYAVRLRKEIGDERFEALNTRAHQPHKFTAEELQEMIAEREAIFLKLSE